MLKLKDGHIYGLIVGLTFLFFLPFLGSVPLFDWDEINFAESAREMLVTGDWSRVTVNYEPFWEKPPLFIWAQALSMSVFGVNEWAARLPNVFIGAITFCLMFHVGSKTHDRKTALLWILIYVASLTPNFYFHSGIIDPLFNLLIFTSVYQLYRSVRKSGYKVWFLAGLFLGLAVLTKGPASILIVALTGISVLIAGRVKPWFGMTQFLTFVATTAAVASIWFIPELIKNGPGFLSNFIAYQLELATQSVASHGQPWFYHFVVLLIGCLPASVLFIASVTGEKGNTVRDIHSFGFWAMVLFWVVLILFSLVRTKIVHYSSMCYLPLTYVAVTYLTNAKRHWLRYAVLVLGSVLGLGLMVLPQLGHEPEWILKNFKVDDFTRENLLVEAGWRWYHLIPGLLLLVSMIALYIGWNKVNLRVITGSLIGSFISIQLAVWLIVPPVQQHTQSAAIDFFKSISDEDVYVDVFGFKSYAHYFYADMQPVKDSDDLSRVQQHLLDSFGVEHTIDLNFDHRKEVDRKVMDWMMRGEIDKDVYLLCQEKKVPFLLEQKQFEMVMHSGGYAAFIRRH